MNLILFDDPACRDNLLPLTLIRPVAEIRVGILTITQKWQQHLRSKASFLTAQYLAKQYPLHISDDNIWVNGALCPNDDLLKAIRNLPLNHSLMQQNTILAVHNNQATYLTGEGLSCIEYTADITLIDRPWKVFQQNAHQIRLDYNLITAQKISQPINDAHTKIYGKVGRDIFIEHGARIQAATLNAEEGPIYLGKNTVVQEGSLIRGPFALCEGGSLNMGAKIRGGTTVGPYAKVGGEISCTVFLGHSNKAHDGFLGNSVVGTWCNLGAGTNASNLKNTYSLVKLWSYTEKAFVPTNVQFCGLIMGDYSRCAINTMFNTATTVGIGCNIFGSGFPPAFIPSFTWGGVDSRCSYRLDALIDTVERIMSRRGQPLEQEQQRILEFLFKNPSEGDQHGTTPL